ncbi:ABC transporter permease [Porticoccaceae bacterium LTM1]|nr:ABC transporter permease [Porticoccaceae bacterium LTM1]
MILHGICTAWRNLLKQPAPTLINILTLAIGLTAATTAIIFLYYHLGFEKQYTDSEQIYGLISSTPTSTGEPAESSRSIYLYNRQILDRYPDKPSTTYGSNIFQNSMDDQSDIYVGKKKVNRETYLKADESFWNIFDIPFIAGNPDTALSEPNTLVMTESAAKRFIDDQEPLDKTIDLNNTPMTVVGVIPDFSSQTILNPDFAKNTALGMGSPGKFSGLIISSNSKIESIGQRTSPTETWGETEFVTSFLKVANTSEVNRINHDLNKLIESDNLRHPELYNRYAQAPPKRNFFLAPLQGLHLRDKGQSSTAINFNSWKFLVILLSAVSVILFVACLNSTLISTTLYQRRTTEISIRKVMGANQSTITRQFFSDSLLTTLLATTFSAIFISFSIPWINTTMITDLDHSCILTPEFIGSILALVTIISIVTTWYPAKILGNTSPSAALENQSGSTQGNKLLNTLTITQFVLSTTLFSVFIVTLLQVKHISNLDIGLNFENMLSFTVSSNPQSFTKQDIIREKISQHPHIRSISSGDAISGRVYTPESIKIPGFKNITNINSIHFSHIDPNILDHYQIELLAGNDFSDKIKSMNQKERLKLFADSNYKIEVLLTKRGLKKLGLKHPSQAIDAEIIDKSGQNFIVIGVVNAFPEITVNNHFNSTDVLFPRGGYINMFSVRFNPEKSGIARSHIHSVYKEVLGNEPKIEFADPKPLALRNLTKQLSEPMNQLAPLGIAALIISLLGLYAISLLNAQRRTAEIGIRKVLGASIKKLGGLMVFESCKPLLISLIIGLPAGYLISKHFLQGFAAQAPIALVVFVLTPIIVMLIAILVTLNHALHTAKCDPANVLRSQ